MSKRRPVHGKKPKRSRGIRLLDLKMLSRDYEAAFTRRDLGECGRILDQILKANPKHFEARLQKARLMGVLCRFAESHDRFVQAIQLAPADKRGLAGLKAANLARDLYDPGIARRLYIHAIQAGCPVEGRLHYAEHLLRMRLRDEAQEQVASVLAQKPDHPVAKLLHARMEGLSEPEQIEHLRQMAANDRIDPLWSAKAGYDLAKALDRQGDYDGAIEALQLIKKRLKPQAEALMAGRRISRQALLAATADLDPASCREWRRRRFKPLSGLEKMGLIVGHPRSGTTLLEQIIDSHPQTQSAEETENFMISALLPLSGKRGNLTERSLNELLAEWQPFQIENARKAYRSSIGRVLDFHPETTLLVDKNPSLSTMICPFVRLFPETRIIGMIRDPRDVVLSCFFQPLLPLNLVSATYTDLEETARDYAAFMEAYARSAEVLEESVMELRYEDLVEDVESAARKVTSFLGQPWEPSVLDFHIRAREKIVRSPTADAVTETVHSRARERWKQYRSHLEPCLRHLEPFLERWGYS